MNKLSNKSKEVYNTLHPKLQLIIDHVLTVTDISLIEGIRSAEKQNEYYQSGKSKLHWPNSRHNRTNDSTLDKMEFDISDAVDLVPYPSGYKDKEQMIYVAGIFIGVATMLGIPIRWGGDWSTDGVINNKRDDFFDCWHFELMY
jgi:peptidoglycan L-alanyl-D-glutamate endopeptidase CwlK